MGWMRRLRTTVLGSRASSNFDDEVRFHLAERTDEYIRHGLTRDQAEREAQRRFGDVTRAREWTRDADTLPWLRELAIRAVHVAHARQEPWLHDDGAPDVGAGYRHQHRDLRCGIRRLMAAAPLPQP